MKEAQKIEIAKAAQKAGASDENDFWQQVEDRLQANEDKRKEHIKPRKVKDH